MTEEIPVRPSAEDAPVENDPQEIPVRQTEEPQVEQVQEQSVEEVTEVEPTEQAQVAEPSSPATQDIDSHLFAIRTTGGQEKVVLNLLQNKVRTNQINIQSVLLVDNLKGYVVVEAKDPNDAFLAIQGVRHIRGQLRGELEFKDIEGYLVKKSTVTELAVDSVVEIIGGPFKGMKATITRVDHEKEEATVILLDAPYQLPVTVDANYLKLSAT